MKTLKVLACALVLVVSTVLLLPASPDSADSTQPRYTKDGKLLRPTNYRDWVYLSSGLGMSYSPGMNHDPMFTNVFVTPEAYKQFVATGKWPEKSMWVVEERGSTSKGSIVKDGRFQTDFMGLAVEVKDSSRPEKWSYYGFNEKAESSEAVTPAKNACWQCHEDHAAVEHTFVQFYPTLKPVAKKFGVYKESAEVVQDAK